MMAWRQHRSAIWAVLALALGLRLMAAVWVERTVARTPGRLCLIPGDADGYWELGRKLAQGADYSIYQPPRRAMRMPGFPALLACSQLVFGESLFAARCLLALVGTLACGLVYWLGCELTDNGTALAAALAAALSPPLVIFSPLLLSETAFAAGLLASLIPWARLWQNSGQFRWRTAALAGLLAALATYLRPTWLPLAPLFAVVLIAVGQGHCSRWCEAGLVVATFAAALSPWMLRNHAVTGHWVATTLWVGPSLYDGLNPDATGDSDMTFFDRDNLLGEMTEYQMDREYRRRAWAFAASHPGRVMELAAAKAARYWSVLPNAAQFKNLAASVAVAGATAPLYLLALAGLVSERRHWQLWVLTLTPVVFFAGVHMVFVGSIRYRLPAEYPLWILAAAGGLAAWRSLVNRTGS